MLKEFGRIGMAGDPQGAVRRDVNIVWCGVDAPSVFLASARRLLDLAHNR